MLTSVGVESLSLRQTNEKAPAQAGAQTADEPRIFAGFRFSGTLAMIFPVLTDSACEGPNSLRVAALLAS